MTSANEAVENVANLTATFWDQLNASSGPPASVHYQRDGLAQVFARLEVLKRENHALGMLYENLLKTRNYARTWRNDLRGSKDDALDVGSVPSLVNRGLAYDERRVAHDSAAIDIVVPLRRMENLCEELYGQELAIKNRLDQVRSERMDLQAQTRLINVAIEVGEL